VSTVGSIYDCHEDHSYRIVILFEDEQFLFSLEVFANMTLEETKVEQSDHPISKPETNDNSNPQQGSNGSMNPATSGSMKQTIKIPPTAKDDRKLFVGGLPLDSKLDSSILTLSFTTSLSNQLLSSKKLRIGRFERSLSNLGLFSTPWSCLIERRETLVVLVL
jgi:hypothetical protein